MILYILSFILPISIGLFFVSTIWQCQRGVVCHFIIKLSLACGIGISISTFFSLLSLIIFHNLLAQPVFIYFFALVTLIWRYRYKNTSSVCQETVTPSYQSTVLGKGLRYAFLLAFLLGSCVPLFITLSYPHGNWDAWAIWNEHARIIYQEDGSNWTRIFSPLVAHADYPLLLPLSIAQTWTYLETNNQLAPIFTALLFTLATIGLLTSSITQMKGQSQGFLVGLCLIATPAFLYAGASEYADIPLSFFYLSTMIFLTSALQSKDNPGLLFLAGTSLAATIFTKNEGYQFLCSILLALTLVYNVRWFTKEGKYMLMSLIPISAVLLFTKIHYAPANDIFAGQTTHMILSRITDPTRYAFIGSFFAAHILNFGGFIINIPIFLCAYFLIVGIHTEEKLKKPILVIFITLILVLVGYFSIYVISPHDLKWHLKTSIDRLFLQLWPSILYLTFLLLPSPETILKQQAQK